MNILKILKDCPVGTKLYTPLAGEVELVETRSSDFPEFSIRVSKTAEDGSIAYMTFNKEGKYLGYPEEECSLFPSEDLRDWTKFKQTKYKPGDFVYYRSSPGLNWFCIYKGIKEARGRTYICAYVGYNPDCGTLYGPEFEYGGDGCLCSLEVIESSRFLFNEEKAEIYEALATEGFRWDSEHLELVTIPPKVKDKSFEPFDKVLVRNRDGYWKAGIFSHMGAYSQYPYVTTDGVWSECIPFEGNEHLIGTTGKP